MAGSVNKVLLLGRVGRDPEFRTLPDGGRVCNFSLATTESWKDRQTGDRRERTEWTSVVLFNENLGNIVEQYVRKGSLLYVEGQLQTRKWKAQDGQDRYTTEVVLQKYRGELTLLDPKPTQGGPPEQNGHPFGTGASSGDLDDEIPF